MIRYRPRHVVHVVFTYRANISYASFAHFHVIHVSHYMPARARIHGASQLHVHNLEPR